MTNIDFRHEVFIFHKPNWCSLIDNYFRHKTPCGIRKLTAAFVSKIGVFSRFSWSLDFADTAKLTGPRIFADKRWVGPVKLLCVIMFNINKIRPKSLFGPVKAQKFSRCLISAPKWRNFHFRFSKFGDPENESLFKSSWWIFMCQNENIIVYIWSPNLAICAIVKIGDCTRLLKSWRCLRSNVSDMCLPNFRAIRKWSLENSQY